MSVSEIRCQIATFLAAGHETSASALTWALYALARAPEAQARLRAAVRVAAAEAEAEAGVGAHSAARDANANANVNANASVYAYADAAARCTYLDWVVREALRLHAPVTSTMRICAREADAIPLAPGARVGVPGRAGAGAGRTSVDVRRGDIISIPIQAVSRDEAVWGPDAAVFRCVFGLFGLFGLSWFLEEFWRAARACVRCA